MSWRGFVPSLVFAAAASAAALPASLLLSSMVGYWNAHALVATALVAIYAAGLARGAARSTGAFFAIGALGLALHVSGAQLGEVAVALTAALAVCRSGVFFRLRPARAALAEGLLGLLSLGMGAFLYGPSSIGLALAVWGYLLVQSAWFLVPGARQRRGDEAPLDAFEAAERSVRGLLEGA